MRAKQAASVPFQHKAKLRKVNILVTFQGDKGGLKIDELEDFHEHSF